MGESSGGVRGQLPNSSLDACGAGFGLGAGWFAAQRSSGPSLQFGHEAGISKWIPRSSRRPNLVYRVRSTCQRLAPIVQGADLAPSSQVERSRWIGSLGMGPRRELQAVGGLTPLATSSQENAG